MNEPKYDEDVVNLGYLKRIISNEASYDNNKSTTISRHYTTKPTPPYHEGDTWTEENRIYTCINTRLIGLYQDSDWSTESGAKKEAENKNKVYLAKPTNYNNGDMWILQSDSDHKAGKKGEILITTVKRKDYSENDWINILSYGSISSINEALNDLNKAINQLINIEEVSERGIVTIFYQNTVPEGEQKDFWYVTEDIEQYLKGNLYQYNGTSWQIVEDASIIRAFNNTNEERLISDGKIQSFYSETEPIENMGIGDLWIDIANNNAPYRYNGTNWVPVYDTWIDKTIENIDSITRTTADISTDLGKITHTVTETETRLNNDYLTAEQIEAENGSIKEDLDIIKQQQATMELTSDGLQVQIDTINNEGVKCVKNTTVDIDEDGVTVGKSDSEFRTTMSNTGTYMYAYDQVIAKYDKDGASMYNLTVENEAVIGNLRCMSVEINGEKRTHIHWIGE